MSSVISRATLLAAIMGFTLGAVVALGNMSTVAQDTALNGDVHVDIAKFP